MESGKKSEDRNKKDVEHIELAGLWSPSKSLLPKRFWYCDLVKTEK